MEEVLDKCLTPTTAMITNLIEIENAHINTNHPDFVGSADSLLNLFEVAAEENDDDEDETPDDKTAASSKKSAADNQDKAQSQYSILRKEVRDQKGGPNETGKKGVS